MWADAVFEGGGVKGIGLVGALTVAEKKGYKWKNVAGTSAGSIIAALTAAGYTGEELYKILLELDFMSFLPKTIYNRVPFVGPAFRLWIKKGIHSGDALQRWLELRLAEKGVRTFQDLKSGIGLKIIASDLTQKMLMILPDDLPSYGHDPGTFSIAQAVRMSCSIPFFFDPVMLYHAPSGKYSCIVDGGVLSNFPVWIFDADQPRWPTFGFNLISLEEQKNPIADISGPLSMFLSMFYTMMDAHDNRYIRSKDQVRTISVPTLDVKITDFGLSEEKKQSLYQSGIKAAEEFFQGWTFDLYLQARGKSRSTQINLGKNNQPPHQKGS